MLLKKWTNKWTSFRIFDKHFFSHYYLLSVKIRNNTNVKKKNTNKWTKILKHWIKGKLNSPPPPHQKFFLYCCKTWTLVLLITNPVRCPLSQYNLVLEKGYFLYYSEEISRLVISPWIVSPWSVLYTFC